MTVSPAWRQFDSIILGQGLAGTSLAWQLRWAGQRVLVIDREEASTSSRVAAGLMTPITGQKLVLSWKWPELWSQAIQFYRQVERECAARFFRETAMIRWLSNEAERSRFEERAADPGYQTWLQRDPALPVDTQQFVAEPLFEMTGGQLSTTTFLDASRQMFLRDESYLAADVRLPDDLQLYEGGVALPRWQVAARRLVFCQGIAATSNPWFQAVEFRPAKGEILDVHIPDFAEQRVLHRGIWIVPRPSVGDQQQRIYRVGATYGWDDQTSLCTASAREELEQGLKGLLRCPYEVIGQVAAVRPIHKNQYPVIGFHPDFPQLGYINGLGSKGALHAPYVAGQFLQCLMNGSVPDQDINVNRRTDLRGCSP